MKGWFLLASICQIQTVWETEMFKSMKLLARLSLLSVCVFVPMEGIATDVPDKASGSNLSQNGDPMTNEYMKSLAKWVESSLEDVSTVPGREDLSCYGPGYDGWGVQTNQKALSAYAVLGLLMRPGDKVAGKTKDEIMELAIRMLRFSLETHIEGSSNCLDSGKKWGHTWISALGIERMMPAVEAINDKLTDKDKELLKKVILSEADWLLEKYKIVAGLMENNKPESNIWNGAILYRATIMYPDCPNAAKYKEKGTQFFVNAISTPSDKTSSAVYDGKKVSDLFIDANFYNSFALGHHGYLNVGYMAICLSNIAYLHFSCKARGIAAPEALYHHAEELCKLLKQLTFPNGRQLRIGGDTRMRYTYCQEYTIPTWLFAADKYADTDCLKFEKDWIEVVKKEQNFNEDGSFFGKRMAKLKNASPLYFTRLESDRANSLALAALWHSKFKSLNTKTAAEKNSESFAWSERSFGSCLVRTDKNIRSWTWMAGVTPFGLCMPTNDSSLAEWDFNLAGQIRGTGKVHSSKVLRHQEYLFPDGFLTIGRLQITSSEQLAEGQKDDIVAEEHIAYAALPDGVSSLCMQYAKASSRVYVKSAKGLMLNIPNDVFNDFRRSFLTPEKKFEFKGLEAPFGAVKLDSKVVNIDGKLNVELIHGADSLALNRQSERQIGIFGRWAPLGEKPNTENLYAEELCSKFTQKTKRYEAGELILDECFAIQARDKIEPIKAPRAINLDVKDIPADCRVAAFRGADDMIYVLAANFSQEDGVITFKNKLNAEYLTNKSRKSSDQIRIPKGNAILFKMTNQ